MAQDLPIDSLHVPADTAVIVEIIHDLNLPDEIPEPKSPVAKPSPDIPTPPLFSGIEIGVDYLKFAGLLLDSETKYEGSLGLVFRNRYVASVEAGKGNLQPSRAYKNADYESEGVYRRIGLNYLFPLDDNNLMSVGLKYAQSSFSETIVFEVENPYGNVFTEVIERENFSAQWFELNFITETRVWKNFFTGAIFRFRVLWKHDEMAPFEVYSIPGYGRAFDKTVPAFNLFVKYRFNFYN